MPTTTGKATEFITFSRGSLATLTDADGKIKWAPHNLLLASEQFDNTNWTKSSATVAANSIAAPNGTTTADTITASGANGTALQSYTALAVPYVFSVWLKRKTGTGTIEIAADNGTYTAVTITSDWALYTVTQTPAAGSKSAGIRIVTSADEVYAWGAHLYRSDLGGMQANASAYPYYNPSTVKNLVSYSEDFNSWTKANLTVAANAIAAPNGSLTADTVTVSAGAAQHYVQNAATYVASTPYTISVYAKAGTHNIIQISMNSQNSYANFDLATGTVGGNSGTTAQTITAVGDGWYRISITFTNTVGANIIISPQAATTDGRTASWTAAGTETFHLWGAQLSDSASLDPYVPNFGAAPSAAAAHGPRLDYDPVTLAAKGLLVEEQRTNLILYSQEFDNAAWTSLGGALTITANTAESPDGSVTADTVTLSSSFKVQQITVTSGAVYTFSVWMKSATTSNYSIQLTEANGSGAVVVTVTPTWQRFSLTFTKNAGTLAYPGLDQRSGGTSTSGSIYIWGAQLEAGAFATSYIPTAASTVTRSVDVASVGLSQFPHSTTEGTFVASVSALNAAAPSTAVNLGDTTAGTERNQLRLNLNKADAVALIGGNIAGLASSANTTSSNTVAKMAYAYKAGDMAVVLNAGTVATSSLSAVPTASLMRLGMYVPGQPEALNGHIRQITYIPRRLTNAELIARTS
jgi:hypothetical protein